MITKIIKNENNNVHHQYSAVVSQSLEQITGLEIMFSILLLTMKSA
jgi:hypothetical protein